MSILKLRGLADRIDRRPDGSARVVDYKFAQVARFRSALRHGWEGQLAAYAAAVAVDGTVIAGAHYRALRDGKAAGYAGAAAGPKLPKETALVADLPGRIAALGEAIARLASGIAETDPAEGLCATRGFAPIARLDEARLDLDGGSSDDEADT
ncbi:MAG: PD-(D/E)XK nuclease family protein [Planctomycetes bacterium]|nr:PD-(D/E)XK nuclease family protein [Planctomycetota bacterium]